MTMTDFDFVSMTPIHKGWSEDRKYQVVKTDGTNCLLRISPIQRYETRKILFEMLQKVAALSIPMCKPLEFGICKDGVYALHSWIDGEDAEDVIASLPKSRQYALGLDAGKILRKIHTIPAPPSQEDWETRFRRKAENKMRIYRECPVHFQGDSFFLEYLQENMALLQNRPQCFQHGDYHIGNMMLQEGNLVIIDFDRYDFGDPWEEFNRIVWCAQASPYFATGQLDGYFDGTPPLQFFQLLAFYVASNTLGSFPWAIPFGSGEIETMMKQSQDVRSWYNDFQDVVPAWYRLGKECLNEKRNNFPASALQD